MTARTDIALTDLPRVLRDRFPTSRTPSYVKCYRAILDGVIPSHREDRRHLVREEDLPAIAEVFGLGVRETAQ